MGLRRNWAESECRRVLIHNESSWCSGLGPNHGQVSTSGGVLDGVRSIGDRGPLSAVVGGEKIGNESTEQRAEIGADRNLNDGQVASERRETQTLEECCGGKVPSDGRLAGGR